MVALGLVTLRWERNGEPVHSEHQVTVTETDLEKRSELLIKILRVSDLGEYVCLAENEVGTASEVFTIIEQGDSQFNLNANILKNHFRRVFAHFSSLPHHIQRRLHLPQPPHFSYHCSLAQKERPNNLQEYRRKQVKPIR